MLAIRAAPAKQCLLYNACYTMPSSLNRKFLWSLRVELANWVPVDCLYIIEWRENKLNGGLLR